MEFLVKSRRNSRKTILASIPKRNTEETLTNRNTTKRILEGISECTPGNLRRKAWTKSRRNHERNPKVTAREILEEGSGELVDEVDGEILKEVLEGISERFPSDIQG